MKNTKENIIDIIKEEGQSTAKILREKLNVSQVLIHRHLKTLLGQDKIKKIGSSPKVFYVLNQHVNDKTDFTSQIIHENWLEIMPNGEFLYGEKGFLNWCKKRGFVLKDEIQKYEEIFKEKQSFKKNNLIDATSKLESSFEESFLEKLWYIDFYSWEIFGKTLLGKLILYAKQNSDIILMQKIANRVSLPLLQLIEREKFSDIVIIPHSVPRKKDFLKTTLGYIDITPTPKTIFDKVFVGHSVAQKTLKSKQERESNAKETLFLSKEPLGKKILLIDDACGSGATLNIAAQKIKKIYSFSKIYGVTFVGSIKGFDVINES